MLAQLRPIIQKAIKNLPPQVRHRAENAYDGFARAKALLSIDREMASFRAITAEEEAASALFRSLQLRGYEGAELLDLKRHQHKAAAPFFLRAVSYALVGDGAATVTITVNADPPSIVVALPVTQFSGLEDTPGNVHLVLTEPLGLCYTRYGTGPDERFDHAVKKAAGDRSVDKLIEKAANSRNRILYAHDGGRPVSQVTLSSIEIRERNADLCVLLAIAVLQVEGRQPMAMECLEGFLKVIKRQRSEVFT